MSDRHCAPSAPPILLLAACAGACGGGSGETSTPPPPSPIPIQTLSGVIRTTGDLPAAAAEVRLGEVTVQTDLDGHFFMGFPEALPADDLRVRIDPAGSPADDDYATLELVFTLLEGDADATLPWNPIVPDLGSPNGTQLAFIFDGANGATGAGTLEPAADLRLQIAAGTTASIDGQLLDTSLLLSLQPVAGDAMPYPLPNGLAPAGFAFIGPTGVDFDPPVSAGLDLFLPNTYGYPIGTEVFIYAYDEDLGLWVNRSSQTGSTGSVQGVPGNPGLTWVVAPGVVTESGLYTAGGFFQNCGTEVRGRLVDTSGGPLADATVAFSTGHAARTDEAGDFSLPGLPLFDYSAALSGLCVAKPYTFRLLRSASEGGAIAGPFAGLTPSLGGVTNLGTISTGLAAPTSGVLVGLLTGSATEPAVTLEITGPEGPSLSIEAADGQFFQSDLAPGFYTASTLFANGTTPIYSSTTIEAGRVGFVTLSPDRGTGSGTVTAFVGVEDGSTESPPTPVAGAQVLLFGSDSASAHGILRSTDVNGEVTFLGVDGPYTVSAQALVDGRRSATSAVSIEPAATLQLILDDGAVLAPEVTLSGVVANLPAEPGLSVEVQAVARGDFGGALFSTRAAVDPGDGSYSVDVPSDVLIDLAVLVFDGTAATPLAAVVPRSGGAVGPYVVGATPSEGLDADTGAPGAIPFERAVSVTFDGADSGQPVALSIELDLPTGGRLSLVVGDVHAAGATALLPDFEALLLSGHGVAVRASQGAASAATGLRRLASLPTETNLPELAFSLDDPPLLVSPVAENPGASELADSILEVALDPDAPAGSVARVRISGTGAAIASGVTASTWTLYLDPGDIAAALPGLPLPMWVDGSTVAIDVESLRAADTPPTLEGLLESSPYDYDQDKSLIATRSAALEITIAGD
jgi:hypothetical protein